jgi:hypothetical protein
MIKPGAPFDGVAGLFLCMGAPFDKSSMRDLAITI